MLKSVYIHIPFCRQKCHYCSFISFPQLEKKEQYLKCLQEQIRKEYKGETIKTLYFGGGTPSLLEVEEISALTEHFNLSQNAEITLELNPETVNLDFFQKLSRTKVNRLSIGSQSFDDKILQLIGRKHCANDIFNAVKMAQECGFKNISLDFIYGLPYQTTESFINDLKTATSLNIQHISLYGLKIEEGCHFDKFPPQNLADDELQAQMYTLAIQTLEAQGFEQYEISNFAKDNHFSHHNTCYWSNQEYYGFGLAAHGYVNSARYANTDNFTEYFKNPCQKEFKNILSETEKLEEEIFLGFRLKKGINVTKINKKFGINFEEKYKKILEKYCRNSLIIKEKDQYFFSTEGFLMSNYILSDFLS